MATIETGRRLDRNGTPIDGTGFVVEEGSRLETLLAERVSPLCSQPTTGEWATALTTPEETDGEYVVGLGIFTPGNAGPAKHIHPSYEEAFEVVAGEFVLELDGEEHFLTEGEELTVPTGIEHTFRCVSEETGATVTTARPAGNLGEVIGTLFGLWLTRGN